MENSKSVVMPIVLKGSNYLLWARTTKIALCGHGLWSYIVKSEASKEVTKEDRKEVVPIDEDKWFQEDQLVLSILQNSLEPSILETYFYCETAKDLWDTLQNAYGNISNLTRIYEVKKAIKNLGQENLEFTKHFGKFRSLWAELEMLRPSTHDPTILNERREQDKVLDFLLTFNPRFNDFIQHLLCVDKLPSLEEVYSQARR